MSQIGEMIDSAIATARSAHSRAVLRGADREGKIKDQSGFLKIAVRRPIMHYIATLYSHIGLETDT